MRRCQLLCDAWDGRVFRWGSRFAGTLLGSAILGVACAIPGQLRLVAPEILGEIRGGVSSDIEPELRLTVTSRAVPTLFDVKNVRLSRDHRFRFDPTYIAVVGREYGKVYRVFLHYRAGAEDRVIWRGEFSRRDLTGPIELDCDLARSTRLGQHCWVTDPLQHRWLVANGERTFSRLCVECHGIGGRGLGAAASAGRRAAPGLDQIAAKRSGGFDRNEVAEWIEGSSIPREHGSRAMPIWGERLSADYWRYSNTDELVGATLDPVVVFLLSIQEK